ncbi:hypothetical protein DFH06DRAFT_1345074 [Mycena polygramma]|nr:hypothetical protein DFH06DRAFT_1345074 [Mycena polygramma]
MYSHLSSHHDHCTSLLHSSLDCRRFSPDTIYGLPASGLALQFLAAGRQTPVYNRTAPSSVVGFSLRAVQLVVEAPRSGAHVDPIFELPASGVPLQFCAAGRQTTGYSFIAGSLAIAAGSSRSGYPANGDPVLPISHIGEVTTIRGEAQSRSLISGLPASGASRQLCSTMVARGAIPRLQSQKISACGTKSKPQFFRPRAHVDLASRSVYVAVASEMTKFSARGRWVTVKVR